MSTTLAVLRQRMSEDMGDWLSSTVTTALAAGTTVLDTTLANVEGGDITDHFNNQYVLVTSGANSVAAGTVVPQRRISDYTANALVITGGNWVTDGTVKSTYEIHKINPAEKLRAINSAARELYPTLHRRIIDRSVVTGNVLPDFNWWTTAAAHKFYSTSASAAIARTANSTQFTRGERYCAKLTASSTNQYMYIDSDTLPSLLDLQGQSVSLYCWVSTSVEDDAYIRIVTTQADGTTQTLTSTTTCDDGEEVLLELENQTLNTDLTNVSIQFLVKVSGTVAYFTAPRLIGKKDVYDYLLPELLQDGSVRQVRLQTTGYSTNPCDDIGLVDWAEMFGWKPVTIDIAGTNYKALRIPYYHPHERRLELTGIAPLEDNLSADTDTMDIDDPKTEALTAWANMLVYEQRRGVVSASTTDKYNSELNYWRSRAEELKRKHRMIAPAKQIGWM